MDYSKFFRHATEVELEQISVTLVGEGGYYTAVSLVEIEDGYRMTWTFDGSTHQSEYTGNNKAIIRSALQAYRGIEDEDSKDFTNFCILVLCFYLEGAQNA